MTFIKHFHASLRVQSDPTKLQTFLLSTVEINQNNTSSDECDRNTSNNINRATFVASLIITELDF